MKNSEWDGPECGTIAAGTCWLVAYYGPGHLFEFATADSCCAQHIPPEIEVLLDEAEVDEVIIADAFQQTIIGTSGTVVRFNPAPGEYTDPRRPWSWALTKEPAPLSRDESEAARLTTA